MSKQWEIKCTSDWEEAQKLAAAGWELVSVTLDPDADFHHSNCYYFKREVPKP